ncbi:MAG: exo-alpha-sialidase [Candidatus Uhrbacteria bacterium]
MKMTLSFIAAAIVLVGSGCSSSLQPLARPSLPPARVESTTSPTPVQATEPTATSEAYVPPTGADEASGVETPGRRRIMTATSADGLSFTKTNKIVSDQANVPDFAMTGDGTLYLYFSGWTVGTKNNAMGVAISKDQGTTWSFHNVEFSGSSSMAHSGDPDIVLLDDGTFRLYSTSGIPGTRTTAIFYSEGTDGIRFATKAVAFQADPPALDSNTYLVGSTWHMMTLSGQTTQSYEATSADGKAFTELARKQYAIDGKEMVMSNVIQIDGGYRMYGFTHSDIRSFSSKDGATWTADPGVRLALDASSSLESEYVKDPSVTRLKDGTYLMAYVTQIP